MSNFTLEEIKYYDSYLVNQYNKILVQEKHFGLYLDGEKEIEEQIGKYHAIELKTTSSKSYLLYLDDKLIANVGYRGCYLSDGVELYIRTLGSKGGGLLNKIFNFFIQTVFENQEIKKVYFRVNASNTPVRKVLEEYSAMDLISKKTINDQLWLYYVLTKTKYNMKQEMERLKPKPIEKDNQISEDWKDYISKLNRIQSKL